MTRVCLAIGMAAYLAALPVMAHPDITISMRLLFNIGPKGLNAIAETWSFDQAFSKDILAQFDADRNGHFDPPETAKLIAHWQPLLTGMRYLTGVSQNGTSVEPLRDFGFSASAQGDIVTFVFGLALPVPVDPAAAPVSVTIRDPDLSALVTLAADRAVLVRGDAASACRTQVVPDPDGRYYGSATVPRTISLLCSPP